MDHPTAHPTDHQRSTLEADLDAAARTELAAMRVAARRMVEDGVAPTEALLRDALRREVRR